MNIFCQFLSLSLSLSCRSPARGQMEIKKRSLTRKYFHISALVPDCYRQNNTQTDFSCQNTRHFVPNMQYFSYSHLLPHVRIIEFRRMLEGRMNNGKIVQTRAGVVEFGDAKQIKKQIRYDDAISQFYISKCYFELNKIHITELCMLVVGGVNGGIQLQVSILLSLYRSKLAQFK